MDANLALPLNVIEGIGPSLAAMLAADGMHVVADLLRVAPERVHDAVSTAASTGVAHAYRLDPPGGRFIGVLVPGLFESFFRTLCVPWPRAAPPVDPQPVRVDRVLALAGRLDVTFLEPPLR
jgi:NAD(P)-dependent dehydrogenase (short-subunit alcohol dehydrogenase family)